MAPTDFLNRVKKLYAKQAGEPCPPPTAVIVNDAHYNLGLDDYLPIISVNTAAFLSVSGPFPFNPTAF